MSQINHMETTSLLSGLRRRTTLNDDTLPTYLSKKVPYFPKRPFKRQLKIWFEVFQTILSLLFSIMFVVENYVYLAGTPSLVYDIIDLSLCIFFFVIFVAEFMVEKKLRFLFSLHAILDYISVVPIFFLTICSIAKVRLDFQFFQFIRILRLFRLFILFFDIERISVFSSAKSTIKKALTLIFTILTLILFFSAVFQAVENNFGGSKVIYFHDAIYFISITLLTIGYGDFVPSTLLGKFLIIVFVVSGLIIIPYQAGKLLQLIISGRKFYHELIDLNLKDHIIVSGYSTPEEVIEFTEELYQHLYQKGEEDCKILLTFPNPEMEEPLLRQFSSSNYMGNILIHICDLTDFHNLHLVKVISAKNVFLISSPKGKNTAKQDSSILLTSMAIKNFCYSVPVYAQVINLAYKEKLHQIGVHQLLCLDEYRMKIIARSSLVRGLPVLLNNLISSFSTNQKYNEKELEKPWKKEYSAGFKVGIHRVPISNQFLDDEFGAFVSVCYDKFDLVCFGIERNNKVLMNPIGTTIQAKDHALVFGVGEFHARFVSLYESVKTIPPKEPFVVNSVMDFDINGLEEIIDVTTGRTREKFILTTLGSICDHVLIMGDFKSLSSLLPSYQTETVLLMSDLDLESRELESLYQSVKDYPRVYWMQGNSTNKDSLLKAGIKICSSVIYIGAEGTENDEEAVETHLAIESCKVRSKVNILCELIHQYSVRFFTPLVHQNHSRIDVLKRKSNDFLIFSPLYASGRLFSCSNLINKLLCESLFNPALPNIFDYFFTNAITYELYKGPPTTFGKLFFDHNQGEKILFGIYRAPGLNDYSYVYPVPEKDTPVYIDDGLYFISDFK